MDVKKTLSLSFFTVMLMLVFSTSASAAWTAQRIIIPYSSINAVSGYWTGLAINNQSSSSETFNIQVYNEAGTLLASSTCITVPAMGIKTDLLENFFATPVTGRMSIHIVTNGASSDRFEVTMFMGNTGTKNPGFAFQTYRSEDFTQSIIALCVPPIVIIPPALVK